MSEREKRLALVLSGGGARGAYEVGVLSFIFDELRRTRATRVHVDIICGTSVGAINSAALAASMTEQRAGIRHLVKLWEELTIDRVLGFGWRHAASLTGVFGNGVATGLVDPSALGRLIRKQVPWASIEGALARGHLRALSITCTEVRTGRSVLFMQTGPGTSLPAHPPPRTLIRSEKIAMPHILASASLPLLFPPVRIGSQLYIDGGLRHNTPMAPAIRLGATHVLVVGTSRVVSGVTERDDRSQLTGAAVVGKVMNALMLDHLDNDLAHVAMLNELQQTGERAFGPDFGEKMRIASASTDGRMFEKVETLILRPSVAIGTLGAEYLKTRKAQGSAMVGRILKWLESGEEADLASYLLFEGAYAKRLIELGRADAHAQRDRISDFLDHAAGGGPFPQNTPQPTHSFSPPAVG